MKGRVEQIKTEIFLFRHGKTEANEKHLYCGKSDLPLSQKGEAELRAKSQAASSLNAPPASRGSSIYPDISHCKIFTSGLKRTSQSLGILYPEIILQQVWVPATSFEKKSESPSKDELFSEIVIEPSFREIDFGDFEMKSYEELKDNPEYQKWLEGEAERFEREKRENGREERGIEQKLTQNQVDRISFRSTEFNDNPCPHGESWLQMKNRVIFALEKAIKNYRSLAIFTHGGPISAIMAYFFPDEGKSMYQWQPNFGEGYKITLESSSSPSDFTISRAFYEKIPAEKCNHEF
ncbi:MAG: histidine phosphatase family protein [Treponema sp.]|nr:histidine phosphatase family protein [Treponema sp.]